jgi:hypothetical protein
MESNDATVQPTPPGEGATIEATASEPPYSGPNRRGGDRRQDVTDRRSGLDRRRGPGRRRSENRRSAEEGEMTAEQWEFIQAVNDYKSVNNRPFPTWTEVLDIVTALGYRKVAERGYIR